MRITENTTAQEVWEYHCKEKRKILDPLAQNFRIMAQETKDAQAEADRAGYALRAAEARIRELEREVEKLARYQVIVEQALADAEG